MRFAASGVALLTIVSVLAGCAPGGMKEEVLRELPIHGMQDVVTRSGVEFDAGVTSDANGSLRLTAVQPTTFRLYEIGDLDVEDARLIYRAKIRTENLEGKAYLEMWCAFPGQGEFFSRALPSSISGTTEWTTQETPFFLKAGQNPDRVKLNLVVEGTGTVWVDDVVLSRGG